LAPCPYLIALTEPVKGCTFLSPSGGGVWTGVKGNKRTEHIGYTFFSHSLGQYI
jgi:hypothetical protein